VSLAHDMSALWEAAREQDACLETGMNCYPMAALERTMKIQEVILRALTKKITWWQAAEIIGITDRQMRRWHWRYKEFGYDGLLDRRLGKPSPRRVPLAVVEQVFSLYREKYFDLNVRHFHEKRGAEHQIRLSYTWVKKALQGAGLVSRERKRGCIDASGSADHYRGCCCTSMGAGITGFRMIVGMTCW
jgi:transposase